MCMWNMDNKQTSRETYNDHGNVDSKKLQRKPLTDRETKETVFQETNESGKWIR